jgi:hypothetical protein
MRCPICGSKDCCGGELNERVDRLETELAELIEKAEAVIARWETPNWVEAEPTAETIYLLRDAVEMAKEVEE